MEYWIGSANAPCQKKEQAANCHVNAPNVEIPRLTADWKMWLCQAESLKNTELDVVLSPQSITDDEGSCVQVSVILTVRLVETAVRGG